MAEGDVAAAREWQAALGLQDCMVVVGGRADIPDFEPIPLSCDTMASAVEILWYRAPPQAHAPTGASLLSIVITRFSCQRQGASADKLLVKAATYPSP